MIGWGFEGWDLCFVFRNWIVYCKRNLEGEVWIRNLVFIGGEVVF